MVCQLTQLADVRGCPLGGAVHFYTVLEFVPPGEEMGYGQAGQELVAGAMKHPRRMYLFLMPSMRDHLKILPQSMGAPAYQLILRVPRQLLESLVAEGDVLLRITHDNAVGGILCNQGTDAHLLFVTCTYL